MTSGLRIGSVWNIPIRLHPSWFIVFGFLTWSLSTGYFPVAYPVLGIGINITLGLVTSLFFFASVLAHELGHSWVALKEKIPVRGITLFIFGGVAQIEREPNSPGAEFRIAIAGPLISLLLGILFGILFFFGQNITVVAAPSQYLMRINLILLLFNLVPGFPLDGGRVFRAIVWAWNHDLRKATRIASFTGQIMAYVFIGIGFVILFQGNFVNGLWLIFIGWFLQSASGSVNQQVQMESVLQNSTVSQAMDRNIVKLPGLTPLSWVVEEHMLPNQGSAVYVTEYGEVAGLLTMRKVASIPRPHWRYTTINQAMDPLNRLIPVDPKDDLLTALKQMEKSKVAEMPVMDGELLVGTLTRENVARYLHRRAELGI
jgi:Zn-dependent protease